LKYLQSPLIALALALPATSFATNGYFSHGTSIAEKGLAGAGNAYSQDAMSAANNPAGMVLQGDRLDVGLALFAPMRSYTVTDDGTGPGMVPLVPGTYESENELLVMPEFGDNGMLNSESSIGVSVYGNGGMNTEWAGSGPGTGGPYHVGTAGVDLSQLFIATTYSRRFSDSASWGISGIIAYQRFEATGVGSFAPFSTDPANLSNNGTDSATGFGVRLGVQGEITPGITLGFAYQPKIDMGEFDDYAGLFAEKGDFDIPSNYTLGLAWHINDKSVFVVDIQQINYSDVAAVSNPIASLQQPSVSCTPGAPATGGTGVGCLGGSSGAGFGWEDMTIVKLGYEWQSSDAWTWRVGYSKTDQPIPDTEVVFNILAPGVIQEHITFGFTRALSNNSDLNFALMVAPNVSVSGPNAFDSAQTIELEMDQYELAMSYSKRF